MAYCRWSNSDIYAYESKDGFECHIAYRKLAYPVTFPEFPKPNATKAEWDKYMAAYFAACDEQQTVELVLINLPYAGESFTFDTAAELLEFMKRLRGIGYDIPDYAIDAIEDEVTE